MSSTNIVIKTTRSYPIQSVAFHPDGKNLLGGDIDGVRRLRVADGQVEEVGNQMGMSIRAISVSRDGKWIVCGTTLRGASVWDGEIRARAVEVERAESIDSDAVDISPDSTRFATCTSFSGQQVSIWDILTGKRLVSPLIHRGDITGVAFSPNGEHIATAGGEFQCIRVFDSGNGNEVITFIHGSRCSGSSRVVEQRAANFRSILGQSTQVFRRVHRVSTG
ncbi:tricorn protease domain 2-containing protein [Imleria badia]|nr:tricorn protease domain 2-containing protein [Imleria badia]